MTKEEFYELIKQWSHETCFSSSHDTDHPAYIKALQAGEEVIPWALQRLKDSIGHDRGDAMDHDNSPWFTVCLLGDITDCLDDLPLKYAGMLGEIREHILQWGHDKNYIDYVNVKVLRPRILKILGLSKGEVFMEFSKEHPECFMMIVLEDVGPDKMDKVMEYLRKKGNGKLRLCANIVGDADAKRFEGLSFEDALELSWEVGVATVRMG
jgi:hypothetical protein